MSRWYGIGGHWINAGLPQYIAIDRNPENGCEIQNDADGIFGIITQLKIFKTSSEEFYSTEKHDGLLHGTKVMLNIFQPWLNKQRCVVSADSYFYSVQACDELKKRVLRFIGVVKTATRGFCMENFPDNDISRRGLWKG